MNSTQLRQVESASESKLHIPNTPAFPSMPNLCPVPHMGMSGSLRQKTQSASDSWPKLIFWALMPESTSESKMGVF